MTIKSHGRELNYPDRMMDGLSIVIDGLLFGWRLHHRVASCFIELVRTSK